MGEYVALVLSWALTTATCFFIVIRDERRVAATKLRSAVITTLLAFGLYAGATIGAYVFLAGLVQKGALQEPWPLLGASGVAVFGLASTAALFVDERRFDPVHLERSWPWASRASAIVGFSQIAIVVHFWKTRRFSPFGFLLGCAWLALSILPIVALDFVLGLIFPELQ